MQFPFNGNCFRIFFSSTDGKPWFDAHLYCASFDEAWSIVTIESKDEFDHIKLKMASIFDRLSGVNGIWTGLHKVEWQWNNGK